MKKNKLCSNKLFLIFTLFILIFSNVFAVNNEETISVNRQYKQTLDLSKYGGQDFADKHIKKSSRDYQNNLLKDRNEIRKRINAVSDLLSESKQYNMGYKWGGNHAGNYNTREAIQGGMDCSGWTSQYLYIMGVKYNNFETTTAQGYHDLFDRLVQVAKRKYNYTIRKTSGYASENGWIYTFAWTSGGAIKHIGVSLGDKLCHARGGPDPKNWKTIDITGRPTRYSPSASYSVEDIIHFIATYPDTAKAMGFTLTNMVDPDKVRSDWASVKKGTPGGELKEGFKVGDGELSDSDLDLAYQMFHIEINFDEWFAEPIFKVLGNVIDYVLPIAISLATLFIVLRILYEMIQLIARGDFQFRSVFFVCLEKMFSAFVVILLLSFYKEMVYKPLIQFVSGGFVDVAFGTQIGILAENSDSSVGNLNSIYYLALRPLEKFCNYWITTYHNLSNNFDGIFAIATKFGDFLDAIFKSLLMLLCCAVSIWLGIKFVLSIFLMQVMIAVTLAFGVINLALTTVPRMNASANSLINAVISSIMRIVPVYLIMFVWIDFCQIILEAEIPTEIQIFVYMALFLMTGFVFKFIKMLIKYVFITINFLVELIKEATANL